VASRVQASRAYLTPGLAHAGHLQTIDSKKKKMGQPRQKVGGMFRRLITGACLSSALGCTSRVSENQNSQVSVAQQPLVIPDASTQPENRPVDARMAAADIPVQTPGAVSYERPPAIEVAPVVITKDTVLAELQQRARYASRVAVIRVSNLEYGPRDLAPNDDTTALVYTIASLETLDVLRGDQAPATIKYRGGTIGSIEVVATHQPKLETGVTYLMFFQDDYLASALGMRDAQTLATAGFEFGIDTLRGVLR